MNYVSMLLSGVLFGVGLALSGMTQPAKVLAFLDVAGEWDPSLLAVMGSALGVHGVLQRLIRRRARPVFDTEFHLPSARKPDAKLLVGAGLFGMGWGIAGVCPGPAFAALGSATLFALVSIGAMAVGMALAYFIHAAPRHEARAQPVDG
jgi:uncharacterized membrane protein YedE/YeeE